MLIVSKNLDIGGDQEVEGPGPLKQTEVQRLRDYYGLNTVQAGSKRSWYRLALESPLHPFNVLLIILAVTSGVAGEYETMGVMLAMVTLSTVLRFYQEWKSQVAVDSLLQYVATNVTVVRNDVGTLEDMESVVPANELVPGDWIKLSPGELIPADVELLVTKDFHVDQAALTGEAIPVLKYSRFRRGSWVSPTESVLQGNLEKPIKKKLNFGKWPGPSIIARRIGNSIRSIFGIAVIPNEDQKDTESGGTHGVNFSDMDRPDVCFMGSAVVSGKATCRVVNTGPRTIFGKLAKELVKKKPANSFQLGIRRISWVFFLLMICMVPPVFLLQGLLQQNWFKAFMFALAVAVGLTPEMFPMIVNTTLAKGAVEMSRKKCIVKQLDGIIMLGAVDVLCTDKTGTLTKSVVTLDKHVNEKGSTSPIPLLMGYLNASFQTCHENPLDTAIKLAYQDSDHSKGQNFKEKFTFLEEIPFDFVRRRLSIVVKESDGSGAFLICKGAVEEMLTVCTSLLTEQDEGSLESVLNGNCETESLTETRLADLQSVYEQLSGDGLRVIGVAFKTVSMETIKYSAGIKDESGLTFVGMLAFLDPPKESTREAIESLLVHNVNVKVLTGDNPLVCKKICSEIGLKVDKVITGQELAKISGPESMEILRRIVEEHSIFAKLTPIQKLDIVKALKMNGHVVAFLGDGINDAPALTEADVGISVDTGMDICKESSGMILLEKDLTVIVDAIVTGRMTYGNTIKYIVMVMSTNFGNVFSILVASAWLPFQPMESLHILIQNLLYDASQMGIPWDKMDSDFLLVPHQWSIRSVLRFMIMIGPWSSIFDISTFLFLWFYFGIHTGHKEEDLRIFQSSWFSVGIVTQTFIVHIIRTPKIPFVESWATIQLLGMTIVMMSIGLSLPYIPGLNGWLMFVPLPWEMYPFIGAVVICHFAVLQLSKVIYLKLFKTWY